MFLLKLGIVLYCTLTAVQKVYARMHFEKEET